MAQAKKTKAAKAETKMTFDGDIARKIWLAGVGAYGRAYDEAQGAAEKFAAGANQTFDDLVAKGEKLEDVVRDRISAAPSGKKLAALVDDVSKKSKDVRDKRRAQLDQRLDSVKKSLGETFAPFNLAALGHAVEALTAQVEALTDQVAELKAEKAKPAAKAVAEVAPKTTTEAAPKMVTEAA